MRYEGEASNSAPSEDHMPQTPGPPSLRAITPQRSYFDRLQLQSLVRVIDTVPSVSHKSLKVKAKGLDHHQMAGPSVGYKPRPLHVI